MSKEGLEVSKLAWRSTFRERRKQYERSLSSHGEWASPLPPMGTKVRQNYNGSEISTSEQIAEGIAGPSFAFVYKLTQCVFMEDELSPATSYWDVHRTVE